MKTQKEMQNNTPINEEDSAITKNDRLKYLSYNDMENYITILTNIIEINNYINSHLLEENLVEVINDMIINMMYVEYSSIFLIENDELVIKGSNISDIDMKLTSEEIMYMNNKRHFILNSKESIKTLENGKNIHSIIGVPIVLNKEFMGYIILSDERYGFLGGSIKTFLDAIATQIANSIKNSRVYKELDKLTKKDSLLDIYNRRYFFEILENKFNKENKFAIVMVDIDDFKIINDTYGHQLGDEVLQSTVNSIKLWLEENDVIARYGGEEFILYISDFKDYDTVCNKVSIIRKSIERNIIKFQNKKIRVTVSFGVAFFPDDGKNITSLIRTADNLLYKAKESGKNTISISKGVYVE